ncbi:arylsulfatase [Sphingomonas sp. HITSZ_GF]|uniref:arylsulfatase n=1 Tax=Sphingomonas sp. HITSZ_GF TaxID=3037247 RepID=UPI00240D1949|nr:arylsulfatase [Sphingomonas sp. HITSZ_GF]MDG2532657.1 arylsulfatase [Sphingomonas sp. HITSZ_GF]
MKLSRQLRALTRRSLVGAVAAALLVGGAAQSFAQHSAAPVPAAPVAQAPRPNVIVILVDDMGFSDIGPYGSEIPTPNLDRLAANGIRFTQFYNTARCSTSRASLMTGLYPHEAGMGNLDGVVQPESRGLHGRLDERAVTIAQVMKPAGYFTGMAGKWHMGAAHGSPPEARGFDRSFSFPGGTYFPDQVGRKNMQIDGRPVPLTSPEVGEGEWYASDLLVDWTNRFVGEAKAQNKPFFLYLPFTAVHFPVMAPQEDVARFKGKYMAGWDALRRARFERQKKMGLIDPKAKLPPPLDEAYDWSKLSAADKDRFDTIMAVYAAAVSRMDKAVGTLLDDLKKQGQLDNTLILFMADNGGNAESGPDGRTGGREPMGGPASNIFVGLNWATLQNTPFQYFKHYTEEGGIATPLIAYWPKGIDPKLHGSLVREPGHLIDVMPTLAQLAGATYPTTYNGTAILPMEGRSMVPAFTGQKLARGNPIFWEHEGNRAVRDGNWKLVAQWQAPWELYDMSVDRSETNNVAAQHPDIVARMAKQYEDYAARGFVDPWPRKVDGGVFKGALEGGAPRAVNAPPKAKGKRGRAGRRQMAPDAASQD